MREQAGDLRCFERLHLRAFNFGRPYDVGWIVVKHAPIHRLAQRLLENAVHMMDGPRGKAARAVAAPAPKCLNVCARNLFGSQIVQHSVSQDRDKVLSRDLAISLDCPRGQPRRPSRFFRRTRAADCGLSATMGRAGDDEGIRGPGDSPFGPVHGSRREKRCGRTCSGSF
jgi:hypothetical protein